VNRYDIHHAPMSEPTPEQFQARDGETATRNERHFQEERAAIPDPPALPVFHHRSAPEPVIPAPPKPPRKPRQAKPADTPPAPELPNLDRLVEGLVREYSTGAVIDAAWSASARLFQPAK
jgi:hypothetical protein